ncbi:MAG TPA: hypothetical protein VKG80_22460 [Trebonia sp.]|nr:hypothetical protein [Trebonia sp.]
MASTRLAEAVDYPGSSVAFAQLLSGMERDGLISREVRGKRTYRITLTGSGSAVRPGPVAQAAVVQAAVAQAAVAQAAGPGRAATIAAATGPAASQAPMPHAGPGPASPPAGFPAEFDYDELARKLLIQVLRRLTATPADLAQTVAGLERELATARARHGTLTAENVRLREQLSQAQRALDLAREGTPKQGVADELDDTEIVLLERLLAPGRDDAGQQSGATA